MRVASVTLLQLRCCMQIKHIFLLICFFASPIYVFAYEGTLDTGEGEIVKNIEVTQLVAEDTAQLDTERAVLPSPYIEAKAGYFFFVTDPMADVYKHGGIDVQLSGAYPLTRYLRIYGSVEYFKRSGYSLAGNQPTSIWAVPLSLGLQPVVYLDYEHKSTYYLTFGPRYFITRVHNDSTYVSPHMHSNGWGLFANSGFAFTIGKHFRLDLFGEYSYGKRRYTTTVPNSQGERVQISGLTFGGGIGYDF